MKATELSLKEIAYDDKHVLYMGQGLQPTMPANQNLKNTYFLDTITSNGFFFNFNQQMHTNCYAIHSFVGL